MVKTYILAPNWSTAPPPEGPVQLGHLLKSLTEFIPANRQKVVEIPHLNKIDIKSGFRSSRSKLVSGELGVFAKIAGLLGFGVGPGIHYKRDKSDILSCASLETMTFDPSEEYIADSMGLPDVERYMKGCRYKLPLYLVTGIKIGRGCSLQSSSTNQKTLKLDGGFLIPNSPANIGGKFDLSQMGTEEEIWEGSTDFIVAFRVRKIWYEKGSIMNKAHNKNVVMLDGENSVREGSRGSLQSQDGIEDLDALLNLDLVRVNDMEDGEDVEWVMQACE